MHTTITIYRSREEVERAWQGSEHPDYLQGAGVRFEKAPGDRGTEIHVEIDEGAGGRVGELVQKVKGAIPRARVKDDLRRFKQMIETGEIPRSDAAPEGERVERKFKQRPAQPLDQSELEKAGI
jgi:uncharacterized membrane protein